MHEAPVFRGFLLSEIKYLKNFYHTINTKRKKTKIKHGGKIMNKTTTKNMKNTMYTLAIALLLTAGVFNFFMAPTAPDISLGPVTVCAATE